MHSVVHDHAPTDFRELVGVMPERIRAAELAIDKTVRRLPLLDHGLPINGHAP